MLIYDVGLFDGSDTAYYLARGHRVIGVEANPALVANARHRFQAELERKQLILVNGAVSERPGILSLHLCAEDLGSSSLIASHLNARSSLGAVEVEAMVLADMLVKYGVPDYLKVDIEGSDRYAILALTPTTRPTFVSYEMGDDAIELLEHLAGIGYDRFKIIDQWTFRELAYHETVRNRLSGKIRTTLGRQLSERVKVRGYTFRRGHSSGPLPNETRGKWTNLNATRDRWLQHCDRTPPERRSWYDLHATY